MSALVEIAEYTNGKNIAVLVGVPVEYKNSLYNCAAVLVNGVVAGLVPKIHIANYNEFYEKDGLHPVLILKQLRILNFAVSIQKSARSCLILGTEQFSALSCVRIYGCRARRAENSR